MQRHSRKLIENLAAFAELDITVIHPHEETVFSGALGIKEIKIGDVDKDKTYLLELKRYSKRVHRVLTNGDFDVIYSQGFCVWDGIDDIAEKLIINPHGLEMFQTIGLKEKLMTAPFRQVFRQLFRKARYTVSLGGKLTGIIQEIVEDSDRVIELSNAVDAPDDVSVKNGKREDLKVLFVGRFAFNKGIDLLFEAAERLNDEEGPNKFHFLFGGRGPLWDKYTEENRFANVELLGFINDVRLKSLYEECDVFVLPTRFEGMPTAVLEAMAHAKPVIVSDTGATSELVDSKNGWLIPVGSVDALVEALRSAAGLQENELAAKGTASVLKVHERFTWPKVAAEHLELFKRFVE